MELPTSRLDFGKLLIRLFAGFTMLHAGVDKALRGNFTAAGFLKFATKGSPLHWWFVSLAGNPIVDALVLYGEILIGLALVLGIFVRLAAICGIIMNGLFWIATYPWEHGPFELNMALITMYIASALLGAGLVLGIDSLIYSKIKSVKRKLVFNIILG
jgi:thiosulfate dehydrogenase [quinone] large subunit